MGQEQGDTGDYDSHVDYTFSPNALVPHDAEEKTESGQTSLETQSSDGTIPTAQEHKDHSEHFLPYDEMTPNQQEAWDLFSTYSEKVTDLNHSLGEFGRLWTTLLTCYIGPAEEMIDKLEKRFLLNRQHATNVLPQMSTAFRGEDHKKHYQEEKHVAPTFFDRIAPERTLRRWLINMMLHQ